ncbi:hypothetical protein LTS18_007603, partial [Coniosporium uncinatum]
MDLVVGAPGHMLQQAQRHQQAVQIGGSSIVALAGISFVAKKYGLGQKTKPLPFVFYGPAGRCSRADVISTSEEIFEYSKTFKYVIRETHNSLGADHTYYFCELPVHASVCTDLTTTIDVTDLSPYVDSTSLLYTTIPISHTDNRITGGGEAEITEVKSSWGHVFMKGILVAFLTVGSYKVLISRKTILERVSQYACRAAPMTAMGLSHATVPAAFYRFVKHFEKPSVDEHSNASMQNVITRLESLSDSIVTLSKKYESDVNAVRNRVYSLAMSFQRPASPKEEEGKLKAFDERYEAQMDRKLGVFFESQNGEFLMIAERLKVGLAEAVKPLYDSKKADEKAAVTSRSSVDGILKEILANTSKTDECTKSLKKGLDIVKSEMAAGFGKQAEKVTELTEGLKSVNATLRDEIDRTNSLERSVQNQKKAFGTRLEGFAARIKMMQDAQNQSSSLTADRMTAIENLLAKSGQELKEVQREKDEQMNVHNERIKAIERQMKEKDEEIELLKGRVVAGENQSKEKDEEVKVLKAQDVGIQAETEAQKQDIVKLTERLTGLEKKTGEIIDYETLCETITEVVIKIFNTPTDVESENETAEARHADRLQGIIKDMIRAETTTKSASLVQELVVIEFSAALELLSKTKMPMDFQAARNSSPLLNILYGIYEHFNTESRRGDPMS